MRNAVSVLILAGIAAAQTAPPPPPPSVSGIVVNAVSGDPVHKATVTLLAKDQEKGVSYEAESDGSGRFAFTDVQAGEYFISADRQGFMNEPEGAPGAPRAPIKVADGQPVSAVKIRLAPLAVITGRVLDEDGDPVRGALVNAMVYGYVGGKKLLRGAGQVNANDKGEFRLFNIRPGKIYIRVQTRGSRGQRITFAGESVTRSSHTPQYVVTFYPSSDAAHAEPIEVSAGAQLKGFDIRLRREVGYSVRGKLPALFREGNPENPRQNFMLQLISRSDLNPGFPMTMDNENFEFMDVPSGSYVLMCMPTGEEKKLYARQPIEVSSSDVEGVTLNLVASVQISGLVRVEGTLKRPIENLRVSLQSDFSPRFGNLSTTLKADGSFVFDGVVPDHYEFTMGNHPGAYLKSLKVGDEEATDGQVDLTKGTGPIVVVLATDVGEVEGTVKRANGDLAIRVRVTLIASGKNSGRFDLSRFGFTDEHGKFDLKTVAPGDYEIFAWEDVPVGAPQDPDFRKPFEKQAVAVKMEPHGHANVELTPISVNAGAHGDQ